ncbi:MAG: pilin N-terminal domain-containing protein [Finegoldia magna]|uniref:pilin N-terminal domain-containing protein n=1 Tax=Finegoldia magna TaxID=1260 RepID=UPI0029113AF3|nr:pilin N-terminal domain-containing protein [Finegoldia magna]MDU4334850.1 pilin N-terminal domain-containing protein [Finegoldia magna]
MKKRFLSLMIALAMMVGVFTPLIASAAQVEGETETLTVHKILMTKEGLKNHNVNKKGYDGNKIENIQDFFETKAKEIDGVYFKLQKLKAGVEKDDVDVNKDEQWEDVEGKAGLTGSQQDENKKKLEGYTFDTKGLKGQFRIVEVHEKSTYKGDKGETLTDKKAVPSLVTLPLINDDGVVKNAHMYPKNTEEAPKIDKNFLKNNDLTAAEQEAADKLKVGADYKNYQEKKATAKAEIGKKIPYEVKTEIPAKSNLAEAHWDDKMTEGLTYNKDLKVKIGETEITPSTEGEDPELVQTDNGFSLRLKGENLALLNGKETAVTVTLIYSATVNNKAIVDIPEANDITFHYGNNKSEGNTPLPTKPNDNGEVKVEKTWDNGTWAKDESATFKLVDANTGEDVTAADLVNAPKDYTFEGTVTIGYNAEKGGSYTWKYLNKDKQYKAVEISSTTPSDAEYTEAKDGTIKVTNHKSNNPEPLNPTEPKVVNGGKKFVKTDQEGKRLEGAEFYVKDSTGKKYLVTKADDNNEAVKKAKETLTEKQKAYENLDAEAQKGEEGQKAKKAFDEAQQAYNKAVLDNANKYEFSDSSDNAVVLRSDADGKFEITGLAYGEYKLEEKTAPTGFAKLNGPVDFTVEKGSYSTVGVDFKYNDADKENSAKQVINKKVTIPQTGGIGTIIFTAIGLAIMASAIIAIKKRQATEAR